MTKNAGSVELDAEQRRFWSTKLAEMLTANQTGDVVAAQRAAVEIGVEEALAILLGVTKSLMEALVASRGVPVETLIAAFSAAAAEGAETP